MPHRSGAGPRPSLTQGCSISHKHLPHYLHLPVYPSLPLTCPPAGQCEAWRGVAWRCQSSGCSAQLRLCLALSARADRFRRSCCVVDYPFAMSSTHWYGTTAPRMQSLWNYLCSEGVGECASSKIPKPTWLLTIRSPVSCTSHNSKDQLSLFTATVSTTKLHQVSHELFDL